MDDVRGFAQEYEPGVSVDKAAIEVAGNERRMPVRAYNHWVSLLRGRAYPSIGELDPATIADFGPHGVLLDFSRGTQDPTIAFLGRALRDECALESSVTRISQVPSRSLLARLTAPYRQIIANRAPIGFEAEFVALRGHTMMYRGILMPFSSDGATIDHVYGVINWKECVDADTQARLDAEVAASVRAAPRRVTAAPAWADGPGARHADGDDDRAAEPATVAADPRQTLQDRPALASLSLDTGTAAGDYVVLLARAGADGALEIVATLDEAALTDKAIRAAA